MEGLEGYIVVIIIMLLFVAFCFYMAIRTSIARRKAKKAQKQAKANANFNPNRNIVGKVYIEDATGRAAINSGLLSKKLNYVNIFNLKDVINCEIVENGKTVNKSGLGSAVVGGLAFGTTGAVVGAIAGKKAVEYCNSLSVEIDVDYGQPQPLRLFVPFIDVKTKTDSSTYTVFKKSAETLYKEISSIIAHYHPQEAVVTNAPISNADEIRKFKQLLDDGIITEEEFEKKKQELL